ncbi:hypothetical protein GPJ56_004515 [Histomonas meleagridis]|uniref:uncharacterized protein n=1 Tax=Histomonas meleagridis TaxID=135588 RepID=UPI00355A2122|nr:hypothetical protein GPJ56_004515 [Histomonas meleagridis]KAH0797334.1 hypothetical protein GO595_009837 [Histomonas meleagridis]
MDELNVTDLTPQNKIQNLTAELERIVASTYPYAKIEKLDENEWSTMIESRKNEVKGVYGSDDLLEDDRKQSTTWIHDNNVMVITLQTSKSEITCNEESIESPVLKGKWWGKVSNLEVTEICDDVVQITFETDPEENWPCLIKGGDPDAVSCYYLAYISLELKELLFCDMWLAHASVLGNHSALLSYVTYLYDAEKYEACNHFAARCILKFGDQICGFILAKNLIEGKGVYQSGSIGEFMLCRLALQHFPDAYYELGRLYLNGCEGVQPMIEKAQFLLQMSAYRYGNQKAQEILKTADFSPSNKEEKAEIEKSKKVQNEQKENKSETSILDWVIAGGITIAAGIAGYTIFRRFFRK